MRHLRPGVPFEADAGLFEQFCRHGEIALRIAETGMSEVDRQVGQESLNVLAFAVPGDEANDRECVSEIVQSRLKSGIARSVIRQPLRVVA